VPLRPAALLLLALLAPAGSSPPAAARAGSVTPLPTATGSSPVVPEHSVAPQRCTATVWVTLRWPGGFQGAVTLTNSGPTPLYGWYVAWELTGAGLAQVWNGSAMVSGPTAMVHAPSWLSPVAPGQAVSAGFLAIGEPPDTPIQPTCG